MMMRASWSLVLTCLLLPTGVLADPNPTEPEAAPDGSNSEGENGDTPNGSPEPNAAEQSCSDLDIFCVIKCVTGLSGDNQCGTCVSSGPQGDGTLPVAIALDVLHPGASVALSYEAGKWREYEGATLDIGGCDET
jgi:hypothetical protein